MRLETTVCVFLMMIMRMLLLLLFRSVEGMLLHQVIILMKRSEVQVFGNKERQDLLIAQFTR